jgi:hypothetical protein
MAAKKIWYAVSRKGQGRVFTSKPTREERLGVWVGESVGCISMTVMLMESEGLIEFPPMTWKDEPLELKLELGYG